MIQPEHNESPGASGPGLFVSGTCSKLAAQRGHCNVDLRLVVENVRRKPDSVEPALFGFFDDHTVPVMHSADQRLAVDRQREPAVTRAVASSPGGGLTRRSCGMPCHCR